LIVRRHPLELNGEEIARLPLYEYECPEHGRFELVRKFSDPPITKCPQCGKPVQKVLSAPAIQFKGSGWYVTDYAKKSGGESKDGGKAKTDGGGKEATSSTESSSKDSSSKDKPSGSTTSGEKKA
jgi:putative FmdB family regulatory protein